jgi:hypothetical protein
MAKKWIQKAISKPGAFTSQAKAAKMGVQEFAKKVAADPDRYSPTTVKRAHLAKTLKKLGR